MKNLHGFAILLLLLAWVLPLAGCSGQPAPTREVILATTTSTQDSGLLDVLLPAFERKTGFIVKPIAVGTGQALAYGERGEADVLLVHAPDAEKGLVDSGAAFNRRLVMHNDFIIVGPPEDPAKIKGMTSAADAFRAIARAGAIFVSRGDDSGTHKMELALWKKAGIVPGAAPGGKWYQEAGAGMGQTLSIASEKAGYTLTDRATYLATRKVLNLGILVEGDRALVNVYHVMQVNPERFPAVNGPGGRAFVEFMVSPEAQEIIRSFGMEVFGEPLFFPDAGKSEDQIGK